MAKTPRGRPQTDPNEVDTLLLDLAASLLAEHFFDPENEARYLELYPSRRAPHNAPPLAEEPIRQHGKALTWRLAATGQRNGFQVTVIHPRFAVSVEGVWQFERQTLNRGQVVDRAGDPKQIARKARSILNALTADEPSADLADLLAFLTGDQETPLVHDDSNQPPPATSAECARAGALVERLCREGSGGLRMDDRAWLEITPQTLPVLTDLMIEAMTAQQRAESRVAVCLDLVTQQLEFVRYRLDRGWDWASAMLMDYQQRLIALGQTSALEAADWFAMAGALTQARVPVSDEVQLRLADAGTTKASSTLPPDQLLGSLRQLSDELAEMADSPFEVIEALYAAGAVMPSALRSFMATELALSAHAALQQAVPLMLLDPDSDVRRSAAAATEQTAATVSPDSLRRAITVRNWIPEADRPDLDRAIRKVRASGVPIGAWPSAPDDRAVASRSDIAFHASMVDGSGAQSILAVSRTGRKGLVAGLLLKHGEGVGDAWIDPAISRADINGMLRDLKSEVPSDEVDRSYVDAAIQHAIAAGVAQGAVPATSLLAIAEATGGSEWKDRQLDVAAEGERLFGALAAADRGPEGVQAALHRGIAWMQQQPIAASWFEDTKAVRQVIATVPRKDAAAAARVVLNEVLPGTRLAWAERFLLMAMWCQAATTKAYRTWATEFTVLTHVLTRDVPLETIPIMNKIALQTVVAARSGGW